MRAALNGSRARLVVQNIDDEQFFVSNRIVSSEFVRVIPGSGVDCSEFHPGGRSRKQGDLRVLLPARLLRDKGVYEYAAAARQLRLAGRKISFLLAGQQDEGNPASVPTEQIEEWVREGVLTWLGHVDDMPSLMRDVDVVVLPSYREGLPKGLIEAAASGCALITTDVPGCRQVVTGDGDGLLIQVRSTEQLASAIAALDDNRDLVVQLGVAARAKAVREFDVSIVINSTLQVYRELTKSSG